MVSPSQMAIAAATALLAPSGVSPFWMPRWVTWHAGRAVVEQRKHPGIAQRWSLGASTHRSCFSISFNIKECFGELPRQRPAHHTPDIGLRGAISRYPVQGHSM